jgi:co-chaperonin GroES (HSP10)
MTLTPSGTEILAEGVNTVFDRVEEENKAKGTTEIVLDKSNKVSFPGFPYKFEALGEKIIVSIDIFKSGYECKECGGKGKITVKCHCELGEHSGLKYSAEELMTISNSLGIEVAKAREALVCPECNGDYVSMRKQGPCPACKGIGHIVIIPETSKNLPTTGVVVSMGASCLTDTYDKSRYIRDAMGAIRPLGFDIGDRILFGPYAGSMIPTRAGLMFKVIDAVQAWCKIEGGEDLAAFDFIMRE